MTTLDMIRELCEKQNISLAKLCRRIGQTPQNFNKKLKRGTVSSEEMIKIAETLGVGYEQAIMGVEERICFMENRIEFNAAKYPKVMSLVIGKSINADKVDTDMNSMEPELAIYLPRGVYLIYLQDMVNKRKHTEIELFKKYAYGVVLEDKDYSALLHLDYASMRMKIERRYLA